MVKVQDYSIFSPNAENPEICYGKGCLRCPVTTCELRECGINVIREKQREIAMRMSKRDDKVADEEYIDDMTDMENDKGEYMEEFLSAVEHEDPTVAELLQQVKLDTIRHILHFWAEKPTTLEVLFRSVLYGQNQSDIAKLRSVSRQNISKIIKTERREQYQKQISDLQREISVYHNLTPDELAVYRYCMLDGCSIRTTAKMLHMSPAHVYRVKQCLRRKMGKSETPVSPKTKKSEKFFNKKGDNK